MTQPTVFDTTNLDSTTATPMAQQLAATMASGQPYSIVGPNAASIMQAAQAINGTTLSETTVPVAPANTSIADSSVSPQQQASIDAATAKYAPRVGQGGLDIPFNLGDWMQSHAGNWGLIILGVLLAIGALLISQKDTIVNIAGKVAPLAAAV